MELAVVVGDRIVYDTYVPQVKRRSQFFSPGRGLRPITID